MNRYVAPHAHVTQSLFSDLAANLGKENDTFGKGSMVLPPVILAYREAWRRYRALANDVLEGVSPTEKAQWDIVAEFIDDDVRTILIARSIRRLIDELIAQGIEEIKVVEAGFGTGFLAAVALATDKRVKVTGYDMQLAKVSVASRVCGDLGFDSQRFIFQQKVIDDVVGGETPSDVLVVAEHISAGLMHELSTQIPRKFRTVPATSCVPYAVHPQLCITGDRFISGLNGQTIILADRSDTEYVHIQGKLYIPGHYYGALKVSNGVTWSGVTVSGLPDIEQRNTRAFRVAGSRNHLLRSTCLHANCDREVNSFWHIRNSSSHDMDVEITVSYPVGFLVNQEQAPHVSIFGQKNVEVATGPISSQAFAQYCSGMRRGE